MSFHDINYPVHNKHPNLGSNKQAQQIMLVELFNIFGIIDFFIKKQCDGNHKKQRNTYATENVNNSFK